MAGLRDRILRDRHDDLGRGLGTIALLSQMNLNQAGLPLETQTDLSEINQLAREMNDAIRDMAWLARAAFS